MEVRPGYKQTAIGDIPKEWEISRLGDVGRWFSGGTPSKANGAYWGGDIPWVSAKDMKASRLHDSQDHISPKAVSDGTRLVPPGTVLMVIRGMILAHTFPVARTECPLAFNQDLKAVVVGDNVDSNYLLFWLIGNASLFLGMTTESTHGTKRLHPETVFRVPFPLPRKAEQEAIAEALSDVDGLLGALDRLIAKKRDLKQAAMLQLLTGQTRLPGFTSEWVVKRLGDMATCFSGGTPPTEVSAYYDGDIPWITSGDLNKEYISDVDGRISRAGLENSAAKMIEAGTLLIALYGATSGVTAISRIRAAINQAVLAIIPHHEDAMFVYFKVRSLRNWLITTYTQGGQPNLSGDIVKSIELPMPMRHEQTAIAEVLSDMDAELAALEQRREKTRVLKQGMMQELLTGRTRLV